MTSSTSERGIIVFDSGVGGITLLHQLMQKAPDELYLYYADSIHVPYGTRTTDEIIDLVQTGIDKIFTPGTKAIVLACNTATSAAVDVLRDRYDIPVIGMEPAIKPALLENDSSKVLVLGTDYTIRQNKFNVLVKALDARNRIEVLSMQELVNFAEEYDFKSAKVMTYIQKQFRDIAWGDFTSIVIGCTHFLYYSSLIRSLVPSHISLINGHEGTIRQLLNSISTEGPLKPGLNVFISGLEVDNEVIMPYLKYLDNEKEMLFSSIN